MRLANSRGNDFGCTRGMGFRFGLGLEPQHSGLWSSWDYDRSGIGECIYLDVDRVRESGYLKVQRLI